MPQFNLPRKMVTTIQLWVSVVLIALALLFSFMPLIKLETSDVLLDAAEMAHEVGLDFDDLPKEVDVSVVKIVSSISLIAKVTSAAIPDDKGGYSEEKQEKQEELEEYLDSR